MSQAAGEPAATPDDAPEVSVRTTSTLLLHFERCFGAPRLADFWRREGFALSLEYLRTPSNFISLRFLERLAERLVHESGDPEFTFKAGQLMAVPEALGFAYYMLRAFGSPQMGYLKTVEITPTYNRVGTFEIEHLERERLVLSYRSQVPERHRLICQLRMGQFASFPTIWGLPPAEVNESECQSRGDEVCRYHLRWISPPTTWRRYAGLLVGLWGGALANLIAGLPLPWGLSVLPLAGLGVGAWLDVRVELRRKELVLAEQAKGMASSLDELRQRYDEIFRINRELEDRVAARTQDLTEANVRLEQALLKQKELDRLKSEFFDNVSHELRSPLTLLLLTLDSLLQGPAALEVEMRQQLEAMSRSASRLLRLINNLLDLAQLEAGKTRLRYEPLELHGVLGSLIAPFQVMAARKGVALQLEGGPVSPVHADLERIESVFQNLVSNAMKFTSQGSVVVRVWEDEAQVHVAVSDTGPGIAAQDLPVIFDRFAQADSSGTRRFGGTGIGLALVKEVLELHAGGIEVRSELGKGSTFHTRLPKGTAHIREELRAQAELGRLLRPRQRSAAQEALAVAAVEEGLEAARTLRQQEAAVGAPSILLVEDDAEIRSLIVNILRPYYRVHEATNGEEGLRCVREQRPDLVLSDVMMPVMSGLQMLKALRDAPDTLDLPIILLTARHEVDARVEGLSTGANDYLGKPFSPREMLARIDAQLRLRDAAVRAAENERLAATGLLTSGFAHEVRNPLNGLMNALLPLRESLSSSQIDITTAHTMLDVVEECGQRIRSLAEGLLSFVRVGSKPVALELGASLDTTLQALSWRLPSTLQVDRDYQCVEPVWCDPGSLNQVWVNLLDNALRAVEGRPNALIRLQTLREGEEAVVRITDNGEGIRPEHLPRLFQPFFSTRPAGEGTGLGLALCQRIILRLGGHIRITSEHGKSTCCEVRLPLKVDANQVLSPLLPEARGPHHAQWKV